MKLQLIILLLASSLNTNAQKNETIDTTFTNNLSKQFFKKNPLVAKVHFSIYSDQSISLNVYRKGVWQDSSYPFSSITDAESYIFSFSGDRYFFHKKYGTLNLPDNDVISATVKKCSSFISMSGYIYPDSIRCKIEFQCPLETKSDPDEIVFTKVEVLWGYKNGLRALQNKIQAAYLKSPLSKQKMWTDSAFMFSIIIDNKDSCLKRIALTEGNYTPFAQFLLDELRKACQWTPSMQSGRPVKSFTKIFFLLNKDGNIQIATPSDKSF